MNAIEEFKKRAETHGVCQTYKPKWDACKSKKQLVDLALNAACTDFFCKAMSEGWGVRKETIAHDFRAYINDRYISQQKGYDAKMYADHIGEMFADVSNVVLIGCVGVVEVSKTAVCELRLVDSNVTIFGEGVCNVRTYGDTKVIYKDNVRHHEL